VSPGVTVVVVTRNRRDELVRALDSVVDQSLECELIVVDDGSTDGTADFVRSQFPAARLFSHPDSLGPSGRRNAAVQAAGGEIVVMLDDDARFVSRETLSEICANFSDPRLGAVALPLSDDVEPLDVEPASACITGLFRAGAVAFRPDAFLQAGGFRTLLFCYGEERDLSLRLMDAGYLIGAGRLSRPVEHRPSSVRDFRKMDFLGRRNDLLIGWLVVPTRALPSYLARMLVHAGLLIVRTRRPVPMIRGLAAGIRDCVRYRTRRRPVSPRVYRLSRRLTGSAVPLEDWTALR
jgi:glycosyltransferase involved in cell wall biosynthesis